jgi:tetratricopeptide (TPR) repeat protein
MGRSCQLGFFARWKAKRELKKAIKRVKKHPSPMAAADLIEKYISVGQLDNAGLMAKQSLEYYPASPGIRESYRLFKKAKYQEEIRGLTQQIKERPNPSAYAMLAELYGEIGETDKTLDICREAIRKFPDYEGTYLIVGKIRYRRYREEGLPRDGTLAVEFFEKALKLNAKNYKTLMQLGELYLELGMPKKALDKFKAVQYFAPEDERARELLAYAEGQPPETVTDVEDRFKELKEKRDAENVERRTSRFSIEELEVKLNDFQVFEGLYAVVITTPNGRQLASRIEWEELNEETLRNAISSIFRGADDSALRMDIGGFEQGIISSQHYLLNVFKFENLVCAVAVSAQIRPEVVQAAVDSFIDECLYAPVGT